MASSSTTLLEAINRVLLDVGERSVLNVSSPVSRKAQAYLGEAVYTITSYADWDFTKGRINAISWAGDTANLGDIQRITGVYYGTTTNAYRPITWVDVRDFDLSAPTPYDDSFLSHPRIYTISGYGEVRLNPYPTGATGQSRIFFHVVKDLYPPTLPEGTFPIPERFMPLIIKKATALMLHRHLDDGASAQVVEAEFEALMGRLRARERGVSTGDLNMFRGNRLYNVY